jgi:MFS family permease
MVSRWGLESNLLPFFLTLALTVFALALKTERKRYIYPSMPLFSLCLYAYGISFVVVGPLLAALLVLNWSAIKVNLRSWLLSLLFAGIVAFPYLLFLIKNYVFKRSFMIEAHLPFSIPLLQETRLSQVRGHLVQNNMSFIGSGFYDGNVWNVAKGFLPLSVGVLLSAIAGIFVTIYKHQRSALSVLVWFAACVPLFFVAAVNINQVNAMFVPIVILAAVGLSGLWKLKLSDSRYLQGRYVSIILIALIVCNSWGFTANYFGQAYKQNSAAAFFTGLDTALRAADAYGDTSLPLYVSEDINLNYVQTLFYLKVPPKVFQAAQPTPGQVNFGRYIFYKKDIASLQSYNYIVYSQETPDCMGQRQETVLSQWKIGSCISAP